MKRTKLLLGSSVVFVAFAQGPFSPVIPSIPGTLVRWQGPGTTRCSMKSRSWAAFDGACYFPIDLAQTPGTVRVFRRRAGHLERALITVDPFDYGSEEVQLPDIPQAHPSSADLRRVARDRVLESKVWIRPETPAKFILPLGPPAKPGKGPLPKGSSFGVTRVYDGKLAPDPHTGTDYPVPVGSPVLAVADGTVALAANLFYEGNAVFIDHGNGLVSMYFHLGEINAVSGSAVRKGQILGTVGSTGRATGPHLFFGVRWHGARINPDLLLQDPANIPEMSAPGPTVAVGTTITDRRQVGPGKFTLSLSQNRA
jgi:hypothetical protein